MDEAKTLLCTVMYPELFPDPFLGIGKPPKVKMLVEVGPKELLIHKSSRFAKGKITRVESFSGIDEVVIECLSGGAQRNEILHNSLLWMALIGGGTLVYQLFIRGYSLGISALSALIVATSSGLLKFLLDGGFGRKQNVVRFHFTPSGRRTFYLEVPLAHEPEIHQALLAAGLNLEEPGTSHQAS